MQKITFGIIVLNGQPFLEYNLRQLYPFAHEIIVVEGAVETARHIATPEGHSTDGTLEMLYRFKDREDPEHKLTIVTARDEGYSSGLWPEKIEMSQAYAKRATGDWLWQVDSDEFYKHEDLRSIHELIEADQTISQISFPYLEFWGGFDYRYEGSYPKYLLAGIAHRIFRWSPKYRYIDHRPPTIVDENGNNLKTKKHINHKQIQRKGIYLYHYSYVFPKQAEFKAQYYSSVNWTDAFRENQVWLKDSYYGLKTPFFIGEFGKRHPQWLERFKGEHPEQIQRLINDIESGNVAIELRPTQDIERLLRSSRYHILRPLMAAYTFLRWHGEHLIKPFTSRVRQWLKDIDQ